jgi:hypothetical protein
MVLNSMGKENLRPICGEYRQISTFCSTFLTYWDKVLVSMFLGHLSAQRFHVASSSKFEGVGSRRLSTILMLRLQHCVKRCLEWAGFSVGSKL